MTKNILTFLFISWSTFPMLMPNPAMAMDDDGFPSPPGGFKTCKIEKIKEAKIEVASLFFDEIINSEGKPRETLKNVRKDFINLLDEISANDKQEPVKNENILYDLKECKEILGKYYKKYELEINEALENIEKIISSFQTSNVNKLENLHSIFKKFGEDIVNLSTLLNKARPLYKKEENDKTFPCISCKSNNTRITKVGGEGLQQCASCGFEELLDKGFTLRNSKNKNLVKRENNLYLESTDDSKNTIHLDDKYSVEKLINLDVKTLQNELTKLKLINSIMTYKNEININVVNNEMFQNKLYSMKYNKEISAPKIFIQYKLIKKRKNDLNERDENEYSIKHYVKNPTKFYSFPIVEENKEIQHNIHKKVREFKINSNSNELENNDYGQEEFEIGIKHMKKARTFDDKEDADREKELAFQCYKLAADKGHITAKLYLGRCYLYGDGVDKNATQAVILFKEAAKWGNAEAQFQLAEQYRMGKGVNKNDEEAIKWYKRSKSNGYLRAREKLKELGIDEVQNVSQNNTKNLENK